MTYIWATSVLLPASATIAMVHRFCWPYKVKVLVHYNPACRYLLHRGESTPIFALKALSQCLGTFRIGETEMALVLQNYAWSGTHVGRKASTTVEENARPILELSDLPALNHVAMMRMHVRTSAITYFFVNMIQLQEKVTYHIDYTDNIKLIWELSRWSMSEMYLQTKMLRLDRSISTSAAA